MRRVSGTVRAQSRRCHSATNVNPMSKGQAPQKQTNTRSYQLNQHQSGKVMQLPQYHNIQTTKKSFSRANILWKALPPVIFSTSPRRSASPLTLLRRQSTSYRSFHMHHEEIQRYSAATWAQANVALTDLRILKTHLAKELHPRIDGIIQFIISSTGSNVQLFTQITALKHQMDMTRDEQAQRIKELEATIASQNEEIQELKNSNQRLVKSTWWLQARNLALDFGALVLDFREASPSCSQVWLQFQQLCEYRRKHRLQDMAYKDYLYQHQVRIENQYGLSVFKFCIIMADLSTQRNHKAHELTVPSFVLLDSEADSWIAGQADRRDLFTRMMGVSTHKLRHAMEANRLTVPSELDLFCKKYPDPNFRTTVYDDQHPSKPE